MAKGAIEKGLALDIRGIYPKQHLSPNYVYHSISRAEMLIIFE